MTNKFLQRSTATCTATTTCNHTCKNQVLNTKIILIFANSTTYGWTIRHIHTYTISQNCWCNQYVPSFTSGQDSERYRSKIRYVIDKLTIKTCCGRFEFEEMLRKSKVTIFLSPYPKITLRIRIRKCFLSIFIYMKLELQKPSCMGHENVQFFLQTQQFREIWQTK